MYKLILSAADRLAIDWIGDRYSHGHDLYRLLWVECEQEGEEDWDSDLPITFLVPENVAWQICEIVSQGMDCFSFTLQKKFLEFAGQVV